MPRLTPRPVSSITASRSALFGPSLRSNTTNALPIAQQSALLGAGSSRAQVRNICHHFSSSSMPDTPHKQDLARGLAINRARFLEAAARIHSKLVIAPSVPSVIAQTDSAAEAAAGATGAADPTVLKNEGQAEIPFIPASQRAVPVTVDDTIVVVGQPKKKKRKRVADKEKADTAAGTASPKEEGEMEAEAEAFDYTSVSNILDDGSDHEADLPNARKRPKHAKGGS